MGMKLFLSCKVKTEIEEILGQDTWENIGTQEGSSDERLEENAQRGAT
jgi:hypothetical protein